MGSHGATMAESEGVGYIFGLSTVLIGLTTIMSMGVFSAYHPYKPGIAKCGLPPELLNGKVVVNKLEAKYTCEEGYMLEGGKERLCNVESRAWEPSPEEMSIMCMLQDRSFQDLPGVTTQT